MQVSLGSDDTWKAFSDTEGWIWHLDKMENEGGFWNLGDYKEGGGMRFTNVTVPQGSVITSAYLRFYIPAFGINQTVSPVNNMIRGEDSDNASTFSTMADFDARPITTAQIDWSNMPGWYENTWTDSPDISTIVQEIVNRAGWVSGNSMVIFRDDFDDRSIHTTYGAREASSFERNPAWAPKLIITYDETASSSITVNTPSVSSVDVGLNTTITARWSTNGTLDKFIFGWNLTGSMVNDTAASFSGMNSTVIKSITNNITLNGATISYQIWGNTTTNTWATTGLYNFTLTMPTNSFVIHGPYYEDGSVAPTALNVTLHYTNGNTQVFLLNGTDGNATTYIFDPTYTPSFFSWTASTSNYTRLYYLTDLVSAEVNIYIPDPESTPQIYQFTISDYAGMTNPYIATAKTINGTVEYMERKPITVSTLSFLMEQWTSYNIVFQSTQGSYSVPFSAENSFLTNLNAAPLLFPVETIDTNYTAYAEAYNSTSIQVSYADYDNITTSVTFAIIHVSGDTQTVDYNTTISTFNSTYPSGSYTTYWNSRDSTESYSISILAVRDGVSYSWTYAVLATAQANPFTGMFDFLGDWPNNIDPAQIIGGVIIILSGIGIFSYFGTGMGCGFSWVMAGILSVIGWFNLSIPMFVFSGFVTVLIYIDERKQVIREI